jgi:fumarate reductase flavoprotein subunit
MEFVQYHPTCMPGTGLLFTEACRGEGGFLVNKDGYRYLQDYGLGPAEPTPRNKAMELGPRDRLSQAFWYEQQKGRTIEGKHGSVVHLDLRHLGEAKLRERCRRSTNWPSSFSASIRRARRYRCAGGALHHGRHPRRRPLRVAAAGPLCRRRMFQRRHPRRQPAGLEFPVRTAAFSARWPASKPRVLPIGGPGNSASLLKQAQAVEQRVLGLKTKNRRQRTHRHAAQGNGADHGGRLRHLSPGRNDAEDLQTSSTNSRSVSRMSISRTSRASGTPSGCWRSNSSTSSTSPRRWPIRPQRRESRGAHQRLDGFEQRDDVNFLKHSQAHYVAGGAPRIDYGPVKITKSQPGTRAYGAAGEKAEQERKASHV